MLASEARLWCHRPAMDLAYRLLRPILFSMDAERAHRLVLRSASWAAARPWFLSLVRAWYAPRPNPALKVGALGYDFPSPIGLAAGLDKDGEAVDFWSALGFGFVEVGTVTPGDGQPGNAQPRLERIIEDRALVNRMGFNNLGAPSLALRIKQQKSGVLVGANLGKAKVTPLERAADDYVACLDAVWAHAAYIVINVSSPNTPGLRQLQAVDALRPILSLVEEKNQTLASRSESGQRKPILVKIAPDLANEDVDEVCRLVLSSAVDGVIATNTTLRRELLSRAPNIEGGVSGRPLSSRALEITRRLYRGLKGQAVIIGVGGIESADDAYHRIRAGASLVQVYSGLIYEGPGLVHTLARGLGERLKRDGFSTVQQAVGCDVTSVGSSGRIPDVGGPFAVQHQGKGVDP